MPDETTILSLPLILPAQAQKHVTHNEALVQLDLLVQLSVLNRTLTTAPALPTLGDRHIVAAGATGPWAGQSGKIALFAEAGWQFTQPLPGWTAQVLAEGQAAVFDGLAWVAPSDGPLTVTELGVSASPDATNRLVVSAPATLLNHAGAGHQLKLNKAAAADTASLLFQTGFSGRAEMGTAGSDDFAVKVSADGTAWFTAFDAEAATGEVTLPAPVHLGGQAADPVAPPDGTLWLNTTTGEIRLRSAGVTQSVGGGVSDGDKGDITVSGSGTSWVIDAGAVGLAQLADIATDSFLGRDTAGSGSPEVLSAAQARGILNVADGATANATDASLRDRATHTGTQVAATISDFAAAVAATAAVAANTAKVSNATHTGEVTGDSALTIANLAVTSAKIADDAVGNDKLANMAFGTIKARTTAGTGNPENATGTEVTALLDTFTSGAKGLAPASGGGTANFLRADGTWAAPAGGGGSPGGSTGQVQFNDGGTFDGAADVEIEGGQLRLPAIATPTVPAAGGLKLFGRSVAGRNLPAILGPSGLDTTLQAFLARNKVGMFTASGNNGADTSFGLVIAGLGTSTGANVATTSLHTMMRRREWLVTTASTSAVVGFRGNALQYLVGGPSAALGGFHMILRWAPATGVATATHRAFAGMRGSVANATDVNPSTLTNICGMGYDAADANIQFLHNDGSGTATKIDLGASFPKPSTDRTAVYEVAMFSPPGTTQSVTYEVTNLVSGAVATGTVTTDIPTTTTLLAPWSMVSVGGTSSVIGMAVMSLYIETDY